MERKSVCIIGMPPEPVALLEQEPNGTEFWGLNQGHAVSPPNILKRCTRWFQIHPWEPMAARQDPRHGHLEWLKTCGIPVYLEELQAEVPTGVRYPVEDVDDTIGSNYFASNSFCYMLALAIHEDFKHIRIYGVDFGPNDLSDGYARGPMEFLLGFAAAKGIKIWVPEASALLKCDMYAKSVDPSVLALEGALDWLGDHSKRMMYSDAKTRIDKASAFLGTLYTEVMGGRARHD